MYLFRLHEAAALRIVQDDLAALQRRIANTLGLLRDRDEASAAVLSRAHAALGALDAEVSALAVLLDERPDLIADPPAEDHP